MSVLELVLGVVAIATVALGCSPPIGGYVEPTPEEMVHYSKHMVVGTVQKRIYPDPYFNNVYENMTYGAKVYVRCTYKGGVLGEIITIHGAGEIPGHCTKKELEVGKEYILMLDSPDDKLKSYSQTYPAETYSDRKMRKYINVCGLEMNYPFEGGMMMKRKECPDTLKISNCKSFSEGKVKPKTIDPVQTDDVSVDLRAANGTDAKDPNASPVTSVSWVSLALGPIFLYLLQ